ncbi:TetR/AcrR family transcriptional regulator [Streptomyces sp. NPDC054933]
MGDKPLRADARRNRERVLAAAEDVFAAKGTSASTEEVARQAGVGIGTVFRHFPAKEALLEAVLLRRLTGLVDEARSLVDAEDRGAAFFGFLAHVVEQSAAKIAFADAVAVAGIDVRSIAEPVGRELLDALGVLLRRAQEADIVRRDVAVPEVHALLVGVSRAAELAGWDREVRDRSLSIVFDGLRPSRSRDHLN